MEKIEDFQQEIARLLALDNNSLFEMLADEVVPPTAGMFSLNDKIDAAKIWLEDQKSVIQEKICGSVALRYNLYDNGQYENIMTVATILDCIAGMGMGLPLNVVAVLIVKQGYRFYCGTPQ